MFLNVLFNAIPIILAKSFACVQSFLVQHDMIPFNMRRTMGRVYPDLLWGRWLSALVLHRSPTERFLRGDSAAPPRASRSVAPPRAARVATTHTRGERHLLWATLLPTLVAWICLIVAIRMAAPDSVTWWTIDGGYEKRGGMECAPSHEPLLVGSKSNERLSWKSVPRILLTY